MSGEGKREWSYEAALRDYRAKAPMPAGYPPLCPLCAPPTPWPPAYRVTGWRDGAPVMVGIERPEPEGEP